MSLKAGLNAAKTLCGPAGIKLIKARHPLRNALLPKGSYCPSPSREPRQLVAIQACVICSMMHWKKQKEEMGGYILENG